jgi:tetratricopeptide (TPR) repeat protein
MIGALRVLVLLAALDPSGARGPSGSAGDNPARALFQQGEVKFNLGDFEGAAADYQAAYEIDHRPALLFNIGQCYRNLGNYERARFFYRRFLALAPRTPNRRETERLIASMSKLLDQHILAAQPPRGATEPPPFSPSVRRPEQATNTRATTPPVYRRTWFWVGVGGVVAGGVAAGFLLSRDDPRGSLPSIDLRGGGPARP